MALSSPEAVENFVQLTSSTDTEKDGINKRNSVLSGNITESDNEIKSSANTHKKILQLDSSKLNEEHIIDKADCQYILDNLIYYSFSNNFNCNMFDDLLAFTLRTKQIDSSFMQHFKHDKFKFVDIETINNENIKIFTVKSSEDLIEDYGVFEDFAIDKRFNNHKNQNTKVNVNYLQNDEVEIELKLTSDEKQQDGAKRNKKLPLNRKHNRIYRSISESSKDDIKFIIDVDEKSENSSIEKLNADDDDKNNDIQRTVMWKKYRSISESRSIEEVKGILKNTSRQGRSYSTSDKYSCSVDTTCSDSCSQNLNKNSNENVEASECCKKTVRFSDIIKKQLFRMDSSILGQRKKNQKKKCQKQRAIQRRNSESDLVAYKDVVPKI